MLSGVRIRIKSGLPKYLGRTGRRRWRPASQLTIKPARQYAFSDEARGNLRPYRKSDADAWLRKMETVYGSDREIKLKLQGLRFGPEPGRPLGLDSSGSPAARTIRKIEDPAELGPAWRDPRGSASRKCRPDSLPLELQGLRVSPNSLSIFRTPPLCRLLCYNVHVPYTI
jgi:hypothetical protein